MCVLLSAIGFSLAVTTILPYDLFSKELGKYVVQ